MNTATMKDRILLAAGDAPKADDDKKMSKEGDKKGDDQKDGDKKDGGDKDGDKDGDKKDGEKKEPEETPEQKMAKRFPQPIRIGDLVRYPVIDDGYGALGDVLYVVRTPQKKIKLIVNHGAWFGFFGRKVAVPIEVVAILGQQIASIDMQPDDYKKAPTYVDNGTDAKLGNDDKILIALTKR